MMVESHRVMALGLPTSAVAVVELEVKELTGAVRLLPLHMATAVLDYNLQ
jgi:hypothetical protein